jgi:nicotinamidase/pyrazinamidase
MPRIIFWDVDTQHDFMKADGLLYVPESEAITATLRKLTDFAHDHGIPIVASADDHVPGHRERSDSPDFHETFPPHCMRGTVGQTKIAETALHDPMVIEPERQDPAALAKKIESHQGDFLLHKHWFDVFTNENVQTLLASLAPEVIVLYGVALDVCDKYAIEGLLTHWPEAELFFVTDAAKAIHSDAVPGLLTAWAERGVRLIEAADILERRLLSPYLAAGSSRA